jgi:hypothetical protein
VSGCGEMKHSVQRASANEVGEALTLYWGSTATLRQFRPTRQVCIPASWRLLTCVPVSCATGRMIMPTQPYPF